MVQVTAPVKVDRPVAGLRAAVRSTALVSTSSARGGATTRTSPVSTRVLASQVIRKAAAMRSM
ncbi:hypothetical protein [Pilimelia anulata]|uniref:hypothetical protein n=1 Tax=Pilimelia anulata TaxID=53371 RepID=UPI001665590D|nr:hypothetical protein [Pilimelia anulata]